MTTISPECTETRAAAAVADRARQEGRRYEVVFRNETGHALILVSACHGAGDAWVTPPLPLIDAGETVTFGIESSGRAAGGVVIYRDSVRGALITFCGSASARPGSVCSYATPTDGLIVAGPQGYLAGARTYIKATYVVRSMFDPQPSRAII